jgi:hypothetical protein
MSGQMASAVGQNGLNARVMHVLRMTHLRLLTSIPSGAINNSSNILVI